MTARVHLLPAAALLIALASCSRPEPADLVLRGGTVYTVELSAPAATAVACRQGRIVFTGNDEDAAELIGEATEVVELEGKTVVPGFIEGHGHFLGLGTSAMRLDLLETRSFDEIVGMVREAAAAAKPGEWILGRGWHQSKWDSSGIPLVRGFPLHGELTKAAPANPVWLTHASGHAGIANAEAMKAAGIGPATKSEPGGEVIRDRKGAATGVFVELAQSLIAKQVPTTTTEVRLRAIEKAMEVCARNGVTSFQDAGAPRDVIALYKTLAGEGKLATRLWVMEGSRDNAKIDSLFMSPPQIGLGDGMLTIRAVKLGIDGALGSRSAWLMEPYEDDPGNFGHETMTPEEIGQVASRALDAGYQVCVHAIGDRANHEVLDAYEKAFKGREEAGRAARFRVEHAQILDVKDIPRFAALGVIASMQGIHCTSDRPWVPSRIGEARTAEGAYVWRKLFDAGTTIINGTDVPVERISPIASFHASVTRRLPDGTPPGGFDPAQKMTREEALRTYTINAAYAAFEEDLKGSLAEGKYADMAVLSDDILMMPEDEIQNARVVMTILGGKVIYRADAAPASQ